MLKCSKVLSLAAAFLIAAAFTIMCCAAPIFASSTTTVTDERLSDCASMVSGTSTGWCSIAVHNSIDNYDYYFVGSPTASTDAFHYTLSGSAIIYYASGSSDRQSNATMSLTIYSNALYFGGTNYYYNTDEQFYSYVYSFTMPGTMEGRISNPQQLYKSILEGKGRSGVGVGFGTPDSSSPVSASSYYSSHVSSGIATGQNGGTTTVTTTTTTVTTTTTTAVTLPPYPYQTNPPFELPSDWTADYSETTPTPSVPPFTTAAIKDVDDALDGADSSFISAIGFWFLVLGEILNDYPLLVYMIVFTIAILLLVGLLYNGGGDDK